MVRDIPKRKVGMVPDNEFERKLLNVTKGLAKELRSKKRKKEKLRE